MQISPDLLQKTLNCLEQVITDNESKETAIVLFPVFKELLKIQARSSYKASGSRIFANVSMTYEEFTNIKGLLKEGKKIMAIKYLRDTRGSSFLGLKEAKDAIEAIQQKYNLQY